MVVIKILEGVLQAGSSSISFTDSDIPYSVISSYCSKDGMYPIREEVSGSSITLYYQPQSTNTNVALKLVKGNLEIIDALTDASTNKALSANQGKVLKGLIDELNIPSELTDLSDVDINDIENGQVLAWNSVSEKFENVNQSGGGSMIDYSTSEQDTGIKWIDGSTIYQKTIDFGALPNNTTKTMAHNISNIDKIIDIESVAGYTGIVYGGMMPIVYSDKTFRVGVRYDNVEVVSNDNWSDYYAYITIRYTKTL